MMTFMIWYYWCSYLESELCVREYVKVLIHSDVSDTEVPMYEI
jgi:hypothetical protein